MYCSTPHTFEPKAHSLFNELFLLDQKLCGWLEDYYLLTAERFRPLLACTSIESDLNSDKPHFTSFLSYNFHSLYWVCQLLLHSSVLHFSASFPTHTLQAEASSRLAGRYAERLHESLTYALQAANGNVIKASAVRLPLYVLQSWYARSAQDDNAQSCYDLEMQLRRQNPDLEFDALLPWSFITLIWLGT